MKAHHQSLLSDLIFLAHADGKLDQREINFIHTVGKRMKLTEEEVNILFENPQPSVPLFTEMERIIHFHRLILVMNVDSETHDDEIVALRNFALKLGIRQGVLDQILSKMKLYNDKIIPSQDLIAIFNTYYN